VGNQVNRKDFVTTRQAARMLNVSLRTIQLWTEGGLLSAWKTAGGHRRISVRSVERIHDQQVQATARNDPHPTVVIVEDDPVYRELYKLKIASWQLPVSVATASDGFEGLLTIGKLNPTMVITDLGMPGMDGFRMIRSLEGVSEDLHVVVITGLSDQEIEASGGLPESVVILKKPYPLDQLEKSLRSRLGVSDSTQAEPPPTA
jgi:excisionase family DNA binding protein